MGAKGGHGSQALRLSPGRGRVHLAIRRWATYRGRIRVRSVPGDIRLGLLMPEMTVVTPAAVVPAPRFTLTADPARGVHLDLPSYLPYACRSDLLLFCMAEE